MVPTVMPWGRVRPPLPAGKRETSVSLRRGEGEIGIQAPAGDGGGATDSRAGATEEGATEASASSGGGLRGLSLRHRSFVVWMLASEMVAEDARERGVVTLGGALVEARGLIKEYPQDVAVARVVDGVSLSIPRGETLGLVGESGSGKSTVARMILRLVEATAGEVRFDGEDVLAADGVALRSMRRRMQIVFQDPYAALNPRMNVRQILSEPFAIHRERPMGGMEHGLAQMLSSVGLDASALDRYPHAFSGGQRQRINIARALALRPSFVVLDEPVSALDVSVGAQVVNLLKDLQREYALTYLFISHSMPLVRYLCDRVAVMQGGRIVEMGDCEQVCGAPAHAYTQRLIEATPRLPRGTRRARGGYNQARMISAFSTHWRFLWLVTASLLAGVMNAMAGGGSFISFPAMLALGVPPVEANATNTVALWPGQLTSLATLRGDMRRELLPLICVASILGGVAGAVTLLKTKQVTFLHLIPWLLLGGSVIFGVSGPVSRWLRGRSAADAHDADGPLPLFWIFLAVLPVCFYIGYFGAGGGFLLMTVLALFGVEEMHVLNSLKVLAACLSNFCAMVTFVVSGRILWHFCLISMVFAAAGGYLGSAVCTANKS